jgi:hypothetical protein
MPYGLNHVKQVCEVALTAWLIIYFASLIFLMPARRNEIPSGATSLPKVFIGGNCIGGCAELSDLVSSGELEGLLKKAKALKSKK